MGFVGVLIILPAHGQHVECDVADGSVDAGGDRGLEQYFDCGFRAQPGEAGTVAGPIAVITACRVRLRPILMTSLATIIGMIPMAMKLGTGAEQYAPMAKAIIGGPHVVCAPDDFYRAGGVLTGVLANAARRAKRRRHWSLHNEAREFRFGRSRRKRDGHGA